ncbi:hypothetical protein pipiens_003492 [Culex pipiens pipiens]|uniref:Uncharacterized protein n=1 Tax=Culex pipiens pipiens TaxID=38569 RepID=A0ABD1CX00_CULPP
MQPLLTILIGSLLALSIESHNAILKSVHSADRECVLYHRDGTCGKGDCTVRCRGLVARERKQCLGEISGGGRLPEGKLQRQLLRESVREGGPAMLGLTTSVGIEHCREFKCLFRCFLIREDLYSDVGGPDIERMSVQCGGRYGDEAFRRRAMECVWNLQAQQLDRCELAYRVANDCVNGEVALLPIFLNVTGNLQFNSAFRGFTRGPPLLQRLSLFQRLPLFQNLPLWLTTPAV